MNEEVTLLGCFSACDQSQGAFFCHSASIPISLRVQNVAPPYGPRGTSESGHAQSVQDAGQEASAQTWCPFRQKSRVSSSVPALVKFRALAVIFSTLGDKSFALSGHPNYYDVILKRTFN